ncbi:MAG TPA: dehydrogenase [Xanthomonadales bacterium]|nr:dehydrogenase [Xanthomonadales bacterium]
MRIAVIGSGIAGLGSAWLLSQRHQVTLYERDTRLGGHTHTHTVELAGRHYSVDSGFIVFNPDNYPRLTRLFEQLGVASQPTTMSFSVQAPGLGLEYAATDLDRLFCQRRNLVSPRFWRMLLDIARFYRNAPALLSDPEPGPTLGEYLDQGGYGSLFADAHLIPMASALWSSPAERIRDFPARYLVRFMAQHQMLNLGQRPPWRVVVGGSARYIDALVNDWRGRPCPVEVRLGEPVERVRREPTAVAVRSATGEDHFDRVVLACHADTALALLDAPSAIEREVLSAIHYQDNDTVLHRDATLLPSRPTAWSAWNAYVAPDPGQPCTVSYCMNLLQSLDAPEPLVVTLGRTDRIDPDRVIARMRYRHPLYSHGSVAAQARRAEIDGCDRIHYAGAGWGFGFHEDGLRSAVDVARSLGVEWP